MHEDAEAAYTIGRDVARMNMNCKTAAQLWCLSSDGTELSAHDITLPETQTTIPVVFFAPQGGEYVFSMSERATDDYNIELLYQGASVATLYADQSITLNLNAGTTNDYSIRICRKSPTRLDEVQVKEAQNAKVIIDGSFYILRDAHIFDAQGKTVK
jgi:hypothetical protein